MEGRPHRVDAGRSVEAVTSIPPIGRPETPHASGDERRAERMHEQQKLEVARALAPPHYLFASPLRSNAGSAASSGVIVLVVPMMRFAAA